MKRRSTRRLRHRKSPLAKGCSEVTCVRSYDVVVVVVLPQQYSRLRTSPERSNVAEVSASSFRLFFIVGKIFCDFYVMLGMKRALRVVLRKPSGYIGEVLRVVVRETRSVYLPSLETKKIIQVDVECQRSAGRFGGEFPTQESPLRYFLLGYF